MTPVFNSASSHPPAENDVANTTRGSIQNQPLIKTLMPNGRPILQSLNMVTNPPRSGGRHPGHSLFARRKPRLTGFRPRLSGLWTQQRNQGDQDDQGAHLVAPPCDRILDTW